jgi:hypothetical protein
MSVCLRILVLPSNLEENMGILGILGLVLCLVGWIWLIVIAYKTAGALWAILIFLFSLLAGLIFCIVHKTGWMQWAMLVVGYVLFVFGGGMDMSGAGGIPAR